MAPDDHALGREFWTRFVERWWEKEPAVLPSPFGARPLLTLAEAFQAVLEASERFRGGKRDHNLRAFRGPVSRALDLEPHLPLASDADLFRYFERMSAGAEKQPFALVVNNLQRYHVPLWERVRAAFSELHAIVGLPAQDVEVVLFMGNYDRTPFGVHRDYASVFHFVLHGTKRIHLWSDGPLKPRGFPYDSILYGHDLELFVETSGPARTLVGRPGELVYWPASEWHVGDGTGELAIAISIGLFKHARVSEHVVREALRLILKETGREDATDFFPAVEDVPAALSERIQTLGRTLLSRELEEAVQVAWLKRLTGGGMSQVPPPAGERAIGDGDIVRSSARHPPAWIARGEDEILCVAAGHAISLPAHPNAIALLRRLKEGVEAPARDLIRDFAGTAMIDGEPCEATPEGIRSVLERLLTIRAITVEPR